MSLLQNNRLVTGVDIGGSHITVCVVNLEAQVIIEGSEQRHHIDSSAPAAEVIAAWAAPIIEVNRRIGCKPGRIGIAMPGPFDYENGICLIKGLAKYDHLYGLNVKEMLANSLSITAADIRMVNDATAYLIGEHQLGNGRGTASVLGITLGTGLGSAWYINGQLVDGDLYCFPFREGVAEDYVSTRWLLKAYAEHTGVRLDSVLVISEEAKAGNHTAAALFRRFGESLGAIIVQRFSPSLPEKVVIGGNIARSSSLFVPHCEKVISDAGFSTSITTALLGESAALTGAACLWR